MTSRHSGGSNLNRVELQNGCEAKARAGLFIPSTLNESNLDMSGKLDNEKLTRNLEDAIGVYISRVQGATCADAKIQYYTGASSTEYQLLREKLLKYLHAGNSQKAALEKEHKRRKERDTLAFKIPPRSPDLNPIENFFHSVTVRLNNDAIKKQITRENYMELSTRVKETMLNFSPKEIDKIIDSMDKRITAVVKGKGQRTKY